MTKRSDEIVLTGIVLDDNSTFTLTEVRKRFNVTEDLLHEMLEYGVIEPQHTEDEMILDLASLHRLESALHLHQDLEVNMPGVALALDLLEQLDTLRNELLILHKQLEHR